MDVAAPPEAGKANAVLLAFLEGALDLPRGALRLTRGVASRDKEVEVPAVAGDARARLLAGVASRA